MTYMLESKKDGFSIPHDEVGLVASKLTIYSIPFSMVTTIYIGYAYEVFGRRATLFWSYFLTGIIFYVIPYTPPNYY